MEEAKESLPAHKARSCRLTCSSLVNSSKMAGAAAVKGEIAMSERGGFWPAASRAHGIGMQYS